MTAYGFSAKSHGGKDSTNIGAASILLERQMYSGETSSASMGTVSDVNSFALGFSSSIENKNKDGDIKIKGSPQYRPPPYRFTMKTTLARQWGYRRSQTHLQAAWKQPLHQQ